MPKLVVLTIVIMLVCLPRTSLAGQFTFRERFLPALVERIPPLLETYNAQTGRFGTEPWIVHDQHAMLPLAVVYTTEHPENPYYRDPEILAVVMAAGDALIEAADEDGKWVFRKKDGSTWGMIHMPWTYARWMQTYALVAEHMPEDRRERWAAALKLAYGNIQEESLSSVHNIPAYHAAALYLAGHQFGKPDWQEKARNFLHEVAAAQHEGGYWHEGGGCVVGYGRVYALALGLYYSYSQDEAVLPALKRAARFYYDWAYPGGEAIRVIDGRQIYRPHAALGNVAFTRTQTGRAYLARQYALREAEDSERLFGADYLAHIIAYGEEGPAPGPGSRRNPALLDDDGFMALRMGAEGEMDGNSEPHDGRVVLVEDGKPIALRLEEGPWTAAISAIALPVAENRWWQDRQSLLSLYHRRVGLILGGGQTKLQPLWSTFTVGDTALLWHKPGDEEPDFAPPDGLIHVPESARLVLDEIAGVDAVYGPVTCKLRVVPASPERIELKFSAEGKTDLPIAAHLPLMPPLKPKAPHPFLVAGDGTRRPLGGEAFTWNADTVRGQLTYGDVAFDLPKNATFTWPAEGFSAYRKDGAVTDNSYRRGTIAFPLTPGQEVRAVLEAAPPIRGK